MISMARIFVSNFLNCEEKRVSQSNKKVRFDKVTDLCFMNILRFYKLKIFVTDQQLNIMRERLECQRHNFHVEIRKQNTTQYLKKKRSEFINTGLCLNSHLMFSKQELLKQLNALINQPHVNYELILTLVRKIKNDIKIAEFHELQNKLIQIAVTLIDNYSKVENKPIVDLIIEEIKGVFIKLVSLEDQFVLPFLQNLLPLVRHPHFKLLMYNISCIIYWDQKIQLKQSFIDIFLTQIRNKMICNENDISIINGFSQKKLTIPVYFQFISIINSYLSLNINNKLSQCSLIDAFDSLKKIVKYSTEPSIALQIVQCNFISRQTVKILQISKSADLLQSVSLFLGNLFSNTQAAAKFIQKQCTVYPLLLQLLLKSKFPSSIKQGICFTVYQLTTLPQIGNDFYSQILSKLVYLHRNYTEDQKMIQQIQYLYLVMMLQVDYQRVLDALDREPDLLSLCLVSENKDIKKMTLEVLERILSLQPTSEIQNQIYSVQFILVNHFQIQKYLDVIIKEQDHQLSSKALSILNTQLDSMQIESQ